jgi:peptidyl-prolyl cis-trans isomerase C
MFPSTHMSWLRPTYIVLPLISVLAACRRHEETPIDLRHSREGSTAVAQWKGGVITVEELDRRLAEMPPHGRSQYMSETGKEEYLEGLSRFELLVSEAIRRGLHKDPRVVHAAKGALVQGLLEQLDAEPSGSDIDEAQLRVLYDEHRQQFERPERLRLLVIVMKDRAQLERLRLQIEKLPKADFAGFGELAARSSEDVESRQLNGDLRYLTLQEVATKLGPRAAEAASLLRNSGDLSKLVETPGGHVLLKLQDREAALHRGFEEVREELRAKKRAELRAAKLEALLGSLKKSEGYILDEAALRKVKVDPSAPARIPPGSPAGFIPSAPR